MKGILLIRFKRSPGAYIDWEYPKGLSEKLEIEFEDVMNIYSVHRMNRTDPNYLQMKFKKLRIASFYTGLLEDDYIGGTDVCLTILIDEDDVLPKDFEGMLRRIADELLPTVEDGYFHKNLIEYYELLKEGKVKPYWYQQIEGVKVQIPESEASNEFKEVSMDEVKFDEYFEVSETDRLRAKVRKMRNIIEQQQEIINKLQTTINEQISGQSDHISIIHKLKDEIDEKDELIKDLKENIGDLKNRYQVLESDLKMKKQEQDALDKLGKLKR